MTHNFLITKEYQSFIENIKENIQRAKNRAVRSVNGELIGLYSFIGEQIAEKQKKSNWGEDLIGQIESDLKKAFPESSGFSRRNLNYMRNLYNFLGRDVKVQQLVAQIPWGHIVLIMGKIKEKNIILIKESFKKSYTLYFLELS